MMITKNWYNTKKVCANLVLDAWAHLYKKFPWKYAFRFASAYIDYCKLTSNREDYLFVDNRLTMPQCWLSSDYRYGDFPFKPKLMGADDLKKAAFLARKDFYKFSSIIKRIFRYIFTNRDLILFFITFRSYLFLYKEVERKFNTPLGMNIDELPK